MINYNLKINFQDERVLSSDIVFVSGDIGAYKLNFDFYDNGKKVDVSKYALTVKAKRADGVKIASAGEIEDGKASFIPEGNIYAIPGDLYLEVALCDAAGKYLTAKVIIASVIEGLGETDVQGTQSPSVYVTLLGSLQSKIDQANQLINESLPVKGVDYYTEEEKEELKNDVLNDAMTFMNQNYTAALTGISIGQSVSGDDVSPLEHEMKVTLERLNVFDNSQWESGQISDDDGEYVEATPNDTVYWSNMTYIPVDQRMYFYSITAYPHNIYVYLYYKDKSFANKFPECFTSFYDLNRLNDALVGSEIGYIRLMLEAPDGSGIDGAGYSDVTNVLCEELVATEENANKYSLTSYYVPYSKYEEATITVSSSYLDEKNQNLVTYDKEYSVDENGVAAGVLSPPVPFNSFSVWSNPSGAFIITCEYNKDANKVIEKLTNAIISLGGNV